MQHGEIIEVRLTGASDQAGGLFRKRSKESVTIVPAYVLSWADGQFTCVPGDRDFPKALAGELQSAELGIWINAAMAGPDFVPAVFFDCRWVWTFEDWVHRGMRRLGYVEDATDRKLIAQRVFNGLDLGSCGVKA